MKPLSLKLLVAILLLGLFLYNCSDEGEFVEIKDNPEIGGTSETKDGDIKDKLLVRTPFFHWEHVKGATSYEIVIRNQENAEVFIFDTELNATTESPGDDLVFETPSRFELDYSGTDGNKLIPYKWQVRAKNAFQYHYSEEGEFYIIAPLVNPVINTPTSICAGGEITFTWTYEKQHTYTVEYSNDNFVTTTAATIESQKSGSQTLTITKGGTYKLRIKANTIGGEESSWVESGEFEVIELTPPTLIPITPTLDVDGFVVFTWTLSGQTADTITIQISTDGGTTWTDYATLSGTETSYDTQAKGKEALPGGKVKWRVKITSDANGSICEATSVESEFEVSICSPPSGYDSIPATCTTTGTAVTLSWHKGSDNLKYYVDLKVDDAFDWVEKLIEIPATDPAEVVFDEAFFLEIGQAFSLTTAIYGTYHYKVRYEDPNSPGTCEGSLPEGSFSYVVEPKNLYSVVYTDDGTGYGAPDNLDTDYYYEADRGTVSHAGKLTGVYWEDSSGNPQPVLGVGYDAHFGLEYYIDMKTLRNNESWDLYKLVGSPVPSNGWYGTEGIDIYSGWIPDGWLTWQAKARAAGDPTCVCNYVDGLADFGGNTTHDLCYSQMFPAGYTDPFSGSSYSYSVATNGNVTIYHNNAGNYSWRIIVVGGGFINPDGTLNYSSIIEECNWSAVNVPTVNYNTVCSTNIPSGSYVYIIIEIKKDTLSCGGPLTLDTLTGGGYMGIGYVSSQYWKVDDTGYICDYNISCY